MYIVTIYIINTLEFRHNRRKHNIIKNMYKPLFERQPDDDHVEKINSAIKFIEAFDGEDVISKSNRDSMDTLCAIADCESAETKKRKKQESINNYAALMTQLAMKDEIYDLPGMPSFFTIKMKNKEYFSYDPRGDPEIKNSFIPVPYCNLCLCPSQYCCDVVFGPLVVSHTETLMYRNKNRALLNLQEVMAIFRKVYSEVVHAKMIFNKKIWVLNLEERETYPVPKCVSRGSFKKVLVVFKSDIENKTR
jgi:hypothetical protein